MAQVIRFDYAVNRLRRTGCAPKSAYTLELIRVLNSRTASKAKSVGSHGRDRIQVSAPRHTGPILTRQDLINSGFVIREPKTSRVTRQDLNDAFPEWKD